METHCDDATCSVSAEVSMRAYVGEREKGRKGDGDVEERHTVFPLYSSSTVLLQETCVHFHKY